MLKKILTIGGLTLIALVMACGQDEPVQQRETGSTNPAPSAPASTTGGTEPLMELPTRSPSSPAMTVPTLAREPMVANPVAVAEPTQPARNTGQAGQPGLTAPETKNTEDIAGTAEPAQPSAPPPTHTPFRATAETDREALVALYEAAGGDNWVNSDNWLTDTPLSEWYGVTVEGDAVTGLDLADNGLTGQIPEGFRRLNRLDYLYLEGNNLAGEIAQVLSELDGLRELYLADNQFTGCIPISGIELPAAEFADYGSLEACPNPDRDALTALYNETGGPQWARNRNWLTDAPTGQWYGVVLNESGRVRGLRLSNNHLRGSLPDALGELHNLEILELGTTIEDFGVRREVRLGLKEIAAVADANVLIGPIPDSMAGLTSLKELSMPLLGLTGTFPTWVGEIRTLEYVDLSENNLEGPIPGQYSQLENLKLLNLSRNQLGGTILPEIANLANLETLNLSRNQLGGTIPPEIANLANLETLDLSANQLGGTILPEIANLTNLETLNLFGNQLGGTIPNELGNLGAMKEFDGYGKSINLSSNSLTGEIPRQLGNLKGLTSLYLARNQLSGEIPRQLGQMESLSTLSLHENQLTGCIPRDLENKISQVSELNLPICQ